MLRGAWSMVQLIRSVVCKNGFLFLSVTHVTPLSHVCLHLVSDCAQESIWLRQSQTLEAALCLAGVSQGLVDGLMYSFCQSRLATTLR